MPVTPEPTVEDLSPLARALYEASVVEGRSVNGRLAPGYCQRLADEMERVKPTVHITVKEN